MVRHIERDHAEDHGASSGRIMEALEKTHSSADRGSSAQRHRNGSEHMSTSRPSRSPSDSSRARSRPSATPPQRSRKPSEGEPASRREGHDQRRAAHHQSSRHRTTIRSSSSQPSVIQAWKELFNGSSRSSRGVVGGSSSRGSQDGRRVRHKSKLDEMLQQSSSGTTRASSVPSPRSPRVGTHESRGSKETPRSPIGSAAASNKLGVSDFNISCAREKFDELATLNSLANETCLVSEVRAG